MKNVIPLQKLKTTLIGVALGLLAACAAPPTAPAAPAATVQPTGESVGAATELRAPTEAALSTQAVAATDCPAGQRRFEHELLADGAMCIPTNPRRVVALDMAGVEMTLLANKTLVATSNWISSELPLLAPQFAPAMAAAEDVGYPANLEKVLALKPDIILAAGGTEVGDAIDIDKARAIAPLVIADPVIYSDWKLGMRFWSEVFGVPEAFEAMEANYKTRVEELRTALDEKRNQKISVISTSTYGVSLWMPDTPPGVILSDVGLARPDSQALVGDAAVAQYKAKQYVQISEEQLTLADGDAIFYFTYASSDPETATKETNHVNAFIQKPIWQSLGAVKAKQAFGVPGYWWRSQTYVLANKVLDDLFTHLANGQAKTPVLEQLP